MRTLVDDGPSSPHDMTADVPRVWSATERPHTNEQL